MWAFDGKIFGFCLDGLSEELRLGLITSSVEEVKRILAPYLGCSIAIPAAIRFIARIGACRWILDGAVGTTKEVQ